MLAQKEDRRIQRTRLTLRSALVSLIQERGFEALTVQDIIDRANVGRSTFYAHFKSKEDLLAGGIEMLGLSLKRVQMEALGKSRSSEERLFGFSRELFAHAEEHLEVFRAMMGKRSGGIVQQHLHRMLVGLVRADVEAMGLRKTRDGLRVEALAQFVAGGLLGLVISRAERKKHLSVEELEAIFRRMAIPAVRAVLQRGD